MARRRYYYRRVIRPKQKWAINNVDVRITVSETVSSISSGANVFYYQTVVANGSRIQTGSSDPATAVVSAAQILKTGRFKFKGCLPTGYANFSFTVFIAYLPEGYEPLQGVVGDQTLFYQHPEWIIGWTRKDFQGTGQSNEISITSRLKRNLNTADQIIVGVMANNSTGGTISLTANPVLQGTLSYCCRAN